MKYIAPLARQILFAVYCLVVSVGLIELGLYLFKIDPASPFDTIQLKVSGELLGEYDKDLFWRLKDVRPEFHRDAKRIMCLTDSVSVMYEGAGYPELLQEYLAKGFPKKHVEVFNGGVPGYTSFQGLKYFKIELLKYNPDLIIVCYGWNDHWQSNNGLPDIKQKTTGLSFLAHLDFLRSVRFVYAKGLQSAQKKYDKTQGVGLRVDLAHYRQNVKAFVELCRANNIGLLLMTAPYYMLPNELRQLHGNYNDVVRDIAAKYQVPLLDLVEEFVGRAELFIEPENDPVHYNWEGSRIIANTIGKKIPELLSL